MNDLIPQAAEGAYPYANGYDNDLYEEELYGLQIELLKLQKDVKEKGKKVIILLRAVTPQVREAPFSASWKT